MNEPRLEDFGLTEADYNYYKHKNFGGVKFGCGVVLIPWLIWIVFVIIKNKGLTSDAIVPIVYLPSLILPFILAAVISNLINEKIAKKGDKKYRNYLDYVKQKKEYDNWWVNEQILQWKKLSGRGFEEEVGHLYSQLGYKVRLTPLRGDEGIDLGAVLDN